MRVGPSKAPLPSPYQGPFKVRERRDKYLKLDIGNRHDMVSLYIIKPACVRACVCVCACVRVFVSVCDCARVLVFVCM